MSKLYSWFSSLILKALKEKLGSEGLGRYLRKIAAQLDSELLPRVQGKSESERLSEVILIMNELAYQARQLEEGSASDSLRIEAKNCLYYDIADPLQPLHLWFFTPNALEPTKCRQLPAQLIVIC